MLKCDICGGQLEMQAGGFALCNCCGMKYSKESLQEKIQGIQELGTKDVTIKTTSTDFDIRGGILQRYNGSEERVVVPDNVIKIAARAFENCPSIVKIKLPESIKEIGEFAFSNCENLERVNLPVKIKKVVKGLFSGCKCIDDIRIPDGVTHIEDFAFENCESLSYINLPNSVVEIKCYAFQNCINLKEFIIPNGITKIEEGLFRKCINLSKVNIPNSIKLIEHEAFRECTSLVNVVVPEGVEIIKGSDYVDYEDDVPWKFSAFYDCKNLENIILPTSLKHLSNELFFGCLTLKAINNDADPIEYILEHNTYLYKDGPFDSNSPLGVEYQKHFLWQTKGVCRYCGGGVKGFFNEVCKKCGHPIDYKRN